ncbi:hypothetical protein W04_3705 [Pseudoalteromonas sp. SW0106-04]|nr:hypothetical protein W04_3705 [Pseudoalteromonas sp. SW0106-04]
MCRSTEQYQSRNVLITEGAQHQRQYSNGGNTKQSPNNKFGLYLILIPMKVKEFDEIRCSYTKQRKDQ